MNDLKRIEYTSSVDKLRQEHTPQVGDLYAYKSNGYEKILKITSIVPKSECSVYHFDEFSFIDNEWKPYDRTAIDRELKEYYSWVYDGERLFTEANSVFNGEVFETKDKDCEISDSMALVKQGENTILGKLDELQTMRDRAETVQLIVKARINEQMSILKERSQMLQAHCDNLKRQVERMYRVISIIEIYTDKELNITTISEGNGCAVDEPLTIRQRILFMDEEVAVIKEDGQGLGHENTEEFYEWLKEPANRDIIVPEERCAVVMKPRRYNKKYSSDYYENRIMNLWNHHSFIVLRDGENVYVAESDNLFFDKSAIPTQKEWEYVRKEAEKWHDTRPAENLQYGSMFYMYLLQGLLDNTSYLGSHNGISVKDSKGIQLIFDDEEHTMLGTDIKSFRQFVIEKNKDLRRGSRIVYLGQDGKFLRYYRSEYTQPPKPSWGLYNLEEIHSEYDNGFGILYTPRPRYSFEPERRRVSWLFRDGWKENDDIISFDNITVAELETYVRDRTQRRYYESFLPMLLSVVKEKRKEEALETAFKNAMRREFKQEISDSLFTEAIEWWKNKVIYVRALSKDDAKSWRMIKQYLEHKLQSQ